MVLFLVLKITYHSGQVFLTEGQRAVFILPVKGQAWFGDMVDEVRSIPFDLADEICWCKFGWYGDGQMNVILILANGVHDAVHFLNLAANARYKAGSRAGFIKGRRSLVAQMK